MTTTADFLDRIYDETKGLVSVWWRPEAGAKQPYSKSAWFTWPAEKPKMLTFIESIKDHDVCITTSTYTTKRRLPEFTDTTQVIWMDSDTCKGERYRVAPSWTTITSEGRWQHFWMLTEPVPTYEASDLVHRISIAHDKDGADQSSWPANKIMRVPGTANTSHGFPTTVVGNDNGTVYDFNDLLEAYGNVEIPERAVLQNMPELDVTELPSYSNVLSKLSADLMELATSEPTEDQDRSRLRYKLLLELFRAGLSYEEVLSVAWHAPASRKWAEEDSRGIRGLAGEAVKAAVEAGTPSSEPQDPYTPDDNDSEMAIEKAAVILTEDERSTVKARYTFINRYVDDATEKTPHDNRSYDRLSAWMILSLAYSGVGYAPLGGQAKLKLNFFGCTIGETTSGKTSSRRLEMNYLRELFNDDFDFNLGGNASETALVKALHGRKGAPSLFNSDEAGGVFKTWVGSDWANGMLERVTELYDGDVTPLLRAQKGDSITETTEAHFNVHLTGAIRGILPYMNEDLFEKGFIPRFIFAIGQPPKDDYESYKIHQSDGKAAQDGFDPAVRQQMANMRKRTDKFKGPNGNGTPILLDDEATARLEQAQWNLHGQYKGVLPKMMLRASILRWKDNVWKAAILLAMDEGRDKVNLSDMLCALDAGEEWFTNLLRILGKMNSNAFERTCSDIEQYVEGRGGKVTSAALFRKFSQFNHFEMTNYLKSLAAQQRVWGPVREKKGEYYMSRQSQQREEGAF